VTSAFSDGGILVNEEQLKKINDNTIFLALYAEHYTLLEYMGNDILADIKKLCKWEHPSKELDSSRSTEVCEEDDIVCVVKLLFMYIKDWSQGSCSPCLELDCWQQV
jgi:hypothetical protein